MWQSTWHHGLTDAVANLIVRNKSTEHHDRAIHNPLIIHQILLSGLFRPWKRMGNARYHGHSSFFFQNTIRATLPAKLRSVRNTMGSFDTEELK
jgi:hypothetical protein